MSTPCTRPCSDAQKQARLFLCCAALALAAWPTSAQAHLAPRGAADEAAIYHDVQPLSWGPLALRSRAPVFDNRLSYTPGRVAVLRRYRTEVHAQFSHVNVWAQMPSYFLDGEFSRLDVRAAVGLGHRTEVSLDVGGLRRSGGYLDGFIEAFHDAFGITQARRRDFPSNRLHVATHAPGNEAVWLDNAQAGVGAVNPVLAVKYGLVAPNTALEAARLQTNMPTVSLDVAFKLPIGSIKRQFATRRVTILADVALEQPVLPWLRLFVTYGLMLSPGIAPFYGMPMSEIQKFISLAVVFRPARDWSIAVQYLNQDGAIENALYTPMERTTHEFGLGAKWAPWHTDTYVLEAGLIENTVHDANTPDFGFSLGARVQL